MARTGEVVVPVRVAIEGAPLLVLKPGERYVLEVPDDFSSEEALRIGREFHEATGHAVVILHGGVRLSRDTEVPE